jgi:hypothetical protein
LLFTHPFGILSKPLCSPPLESAASWSKQYTSLSDTM